MDYSFLDFLGLLGAVGLFLYGMKVMSEGLQKAAGDRLRNILSAMTRNRFTGLLTGCVIMGVNMGANVGTTFTAWIIALFGFKMNISVIVLPLIGLAVVLLLMNKSKTKSIGEFMLGFSFLFMGLDLISQYVPDLQNNPEMFAVLRALASLVTFHLACALVLGSNIGTTITPILASMSGNVAAKRASMGHLLFNLLGTIWCLCIFVPFANFNAWLTEVIGQGDPNALYNYVTGLEATNPELYNHLFDNSLPASHDVIQKIGMMQMSVSFGLSIFHTTFNLVNVSVMIWMTGLYVKIVEWLVPSKNRDDEDFTLKFISGGLMSASELNIAQAEKEISVYAERVGRMITMAQAPIHTKEKSEEYNSLLSRVEKYEDISDRMELEIAHYLNRCAEGRLSNEGKLRIAAMLNIISEIESIADSCLGIGKIMNRKIQSGAEFNEEIYSNIDTMYIYIKQAMDMMIEQLKNIENVSSKSLIDSYNKEREINNLRNTLRGSNVENINSKHYEYQAGIYYMDIIGDLEKTGDYIINVVDTLRDNFRKRVD